MRPHGIAQHKPLTLVVLMLGGSLALAMPAAAQTKPTTVEAIANYAGLIVTMLEERAQEAAAALPPRHADSAADRPLKYPFIRSSCRSASSADAARKVVEDMPPLHATKVDAYELASHGLIVPRPGPAAAFHLAGNAELRSEAIEPRKHWVVARVLYRARLQYQSGAAGQGAENLRGSAGARVEGQDGDVGSTATSGNWVGTLVVLHGEASSASWRRRISESTKSPDGRWPTS
jgi:hypothetical protein